MEKYLNFFNNDKEKIKLHLVKNFILLFFFNEFTILFKILNFFYIKLNSLLFVKNININFLFSNYVYLNFMVNSKDFFLLNIFTIKKQNSIMKKKINVSNNFLFFNYKNSRILEKNFYLEQGIKNDKNILNKYCYYYNFFNFFFNFTSKVNVSKLIDVRKKIKKLVLDNRKILNILNNNGVKYSKKLTKVIFFNSKLKIWWNLVNFEKKLYNVLINSCLVSSFSDSFNFIKNKNIFVNRILVTNPYKLLNLGDCVEIVINKNYFIYNYNLNIMFDKNLIKFKSKLVSNMKQKDNTISNSDKFILKLLKDNYFFKKNIPNYLEVDFFVLSCIFFREIKSFDDISYVNRKLVTFFMYRLYNWKWIS